MFKIGELHEVDNENIKIKKFYLDSYDYITKKNSTYQYLSFKIDGKDKNNSYSLYFEINEDIKELLNLKKLEKKNMDEMIREYSFIINDNYEVSPKLDVTLTRYMENKYNVYITFIIEGEKSFDEKYSGIIEFDFDLDKYVGD